MSLRFLMVLTAILSTAVSYCQTPTLASVIQPDPSLEKVMLIWVPVSSIPAGDRSSMRIYAEVACQNETLKSSFDALPAVDPNSTGPHWFLVIRLGACVPKTAGTKILYVIAASAPVDVTVK